MSYSTELYRQRWVLLSIYVFFNIYYCFVFSLRGTLGGDFKNEYYSAPMSLCASLILILLTLGGLTFFYNRLQLVSVSPCGPPQSKLFDILFLAIALIYFYGSVNGYCASFSDDGEQISRPFYFSLFLFVIHPDYILLIYIFYRVVNISFVYVLIFVITLMSFIIGGRTLIFIFILPLINIYFILVKSRRFKLFSNVSVVLIAVAIYPFIRATKWLVPLLFIDGGGGVEHIFNMYVSDVFNGDFINWYTSSLDGALERFQHVANVSFLMGNEKVIDYINSFDYRAFGGSVGYVINKLTGLGDFNINNIYASAIDGRFTWEVHTGLAGLYFINGSVFFGTLAVIFFTLPLLVFLSKSIDRYNILRELNWLCLVIYLFHGWITAYILHVEALFLFWVFVKASKLKVFSWF